MNMAGILSIFGGTVPENAYAVRAVATMQLTAMGTLKNFGLGQALDGLSDLLFFNALHLELLSTEEALDPKLGMERKVIKSPARLNLFNFKRELDELTYEAKLQVDKNFGELGAILVTNEHRMEFFLKHIVVEGLPQGLVKVHCESWIHSKHDNNERRCFFTNKCYLPSQTPSGLNKWREKELENLRGDGEGERKAHDRIYDYDTYNDLGDPDNDSDLHRPVIGTELHPYPRRCRTGRPRSPADQLSEARIGDFYVPRDEAFSDKKKLTVTFSKLDNLLQQLIPTIEAKIGDTEFDSFKDILRLFNKGIELTATKKNKKIMQIEFPDFFPRDDNILTFPYTESMARDEFAWLSDEEFARETLAGMNPCAIQLVTEWPLKSNLDPEVYGPPESAITSEVIGEQIKGIMSFNEALEQKKLFMLDYHDLFLPFVNKIRKLEGTTLYGSRALFFLDPQGTLRPVAIELTRPPTDDGKPQWKKVFIPCNWDSTESWLWRLAKIHVLAHDAGIHQLVSHWLRTHSCVETYIIASNRQLSAMHPIYRLLRPYFRFTMSINALARQKLINAGGIIESTFFSKRYSVELGSAVYDKAWRFDHQGLPADLISRGMAVDDPHAPHGLNLAIEDYPFANDGLILWEAIKQWVTDYVKHYYTSEDLILSDNELQAWWEEVRTKGHPEKKDEPWWPMVNTRSSLIDILTSIIWVASGHHAAVNFGQYAYAGYFPNMPTIARIKMPSEDPTEQEWNKFLNNPVQVLLDTLPSKSQATKVMMTLNILSTHSIDEEYIGDQIEPSWDEELEIKAAFERLNTRLKDLDSVIDSRNEDIKLRNRTGAGTVPYRLLKPFSKPGVTGMGVPNSISI